MEVFDLAGCLRVIGPAGEQGGSRRHGAWLRRALRSRAACPRSTVRCPTALQRAAPSPVLPGRTSSHASSLVASTTQRERQATREWSSTMLKTFTATVLVAITHSQKSICHHSFGAGASNRRHDDFGRFYGCRSTNPRAPGSGAPSPPTAPPLELRVPTEVPLDRRRPVFVALVGKLLAQRHHRVFHGWRPPSGTCTDAASAPRARPPRPSRQRAAHL